jgi:hypothetical protein
LCWKTECEEGASFTSRGDCSTTQEEPEAVASNNEERISHVIGQVVLQDDPGVLTNVRVHPENLETSAEVSNSQEHKVVRTSTRQKKPPTTRKEDLLW